MVVNTFSVLDRKYTFWVNLVQQSKLSGAEFNGAVYFFCFWPEVPFLGKFGPKNKNCQFQLKFGGSTNSNMQNSMDWKHPF